MNFPIKRKAKREIAEVILVSKKIANQKIL